MVCATVKLAMGLMELLTKGSEEIKLAGDHQNEHGVQALA
jgi:hypothetical protein